MKKFYSFLGALLVATGLFAQTNYTCTFLANVPMDSVQVKNTVSGEAKMLYYPDNVITLQKVEKQDVAIATVANSAFLQQTANNIVAVNVETASLLNLTLYSANGTVVARYANAVSAGQYTFQVGASAGVYVLVASANAQTASLKLSLQENAQAGIFEVATAEPVAFLKSADDVITFNEGEEFEFTGYYKKQTDVKTSAIIKDEEIIFAFEEEKYVDLGLSVKWATCNIGANKPEECGDYYAWGETTPKNSYTWGSYKYGYTYNTLITLTKYCNDSNYGSVDNKKTLDKDDDVAYTILGENWRMPTDAEWTELMTLCKWIDTTINGMKGFKVVADNGNSIFLPSAGYRNDQLYQNGYAGNYWSNSNVGYAPYYAWQVYFDSGTKKKYDQYRYDGLSVRPVYESEEIGGEIEPGDVKIENGAIQAAFSVSADKQVYFSMGNLQYQASTGLWRFAENQYDMIKGDNGNISETYEGWIDLFGWGTSGWNSGANAYQPYSTTSNYFDYYVGGSYSNSLTGSYANADWGVYNKISNGGNQSEMWRTLTKDEWYYLINNRPNADKLYSQGSVDGVTGFIILPDNWTVPSTISFTHQAGNWIKNSYSLDKWNVMQSYGAVFLPGAGMRSNTNWTCFSIGDGSYWSSSCDDIENENSEFNAYCMYFNNYSVTADSRGNRRMGRSVRLVQDVE